MTELDDALKALKEYAEGPLEAHFDWEQAGFVLEHIDSLALAASQQQGPEIKGLVVKPLEWHEYPTIKHEYGVGLWEANSANKTFTILDVGADGKNGNRYYFRGYSQFETLEQAKAAAQIDQDARIRAALAPSVVAEPTPAKHKRSMTLDLTDVEVAALEALAEKQQLSPQRVLIQGLRHYHLLVNGEPDLGPMLPPGFGTPSPHKGEPAAWRYRDSRRDGSKWTVQKNKPDWAGRPGWEAYAVEPLYAAPPPMEGMDGTRVMLIDREDGGLRVWSPDLPGLILSGADPARVASAIPAAIKGLREYAATPNHPEPPSTPL